MGNDRNERENGIETEVYALVLDVERAEYRLELKGSGAVVFRSAGPLMMTPEFPDVRVKIGTPRVLGRGAAPRGGTYLLLRARLSGDVSGWVENRITGLRDRIVCTSRYLADKDHHVAHWHVLGAGGALGLPSVHAYVGESKSFLVTDVSENFADDLGYMLRALPSLRAWLPGWWIKPHTIYQPERVAEHIRLTRAVIPDGIPEFGIILPENMTAEQMGDIRDALALCGAHTV
jgi:hypothetical protein